MKKLIAILVFVLALAASTCDADIGLGKYQRAYPHQHRTSEDGGTLYLSSSQTVTVTTTTQTLSTSLTVTTGDKIVICSAADITFATAATYRYVTVGKTSGTATIRFSSLSTNFIYTLNSIASLEVVGESGCMIADVTGNGTLVIGSTITITGGTGPVIVYNLLRYGFLLKQ